MAIFLGGIPLAKMELETTTAEAREGSNGTDLRNIRSNRWQFLCNGKGPATVEGAARDNEIYLWRYPRIVQPSITAQTLGGSRVSAASEEPQQGS